jgi:hypothetical protein
MIFGDPRYAQLDDLMAIAELWQWRAVHMGAPEDARRGTASGLNRIPDIFLNVYLYRSIYRYR